MIPDFVFAQAKLLRIKFSDRENCNNRSFRNANLITSVAFFQIPPVVNSVYHNAVFGKNTSARNGPLL